MRSGKTLSSPRNFPLDHPRPKRNHTEQQAAFGVYLVLALIMKQHRFLASKETCTALRELARPWAACVAFSSGRAVVVLEAGHAVHLSSYVVEKEPRFECERIEAELSLGVSSASLLGEPVNSVELIEFEETFSESASCTLSEGVLVTHPGGSQTLVCSSTSFYQLQVLTDPAQIAQRLVGRRLVPLGAER